MAEGTSGFWSYVHRDNDQTGGKIDRLAARIADEFALLTGNELQLFLDRSAIEWGDIWRERIEEALQETTFFIPVITPRYFTSAECRKELMEFASNARSVGATELLLPILYVDVLDLDEGSQDEARALVAATQYVDWRELRLSDEASEPYTRAVHALASRLASIAADYEAKPSTLPSTPAAIEGDDEPGMIDVIAQMEPALPAWTETMGEFNTLLQKISSVATHHGERFSPTDSFAQRVLIGREFAADLAEPAAAILALGERYAGHVIDIDPGMRAMIALGGEQEDAENKAAAIGMFEATREMVRSGRETVKNLNEMIVSMRGTSRLLKDLRPPLNQIEAGVRNVIDGQTVLDEWERLIDESEIWDEQ